MPTLVGTLAGGGCLFKARVIQPGSIRMMRCLHLLVLLQDAEIGSAEP
jgi:hypothetical protein